MTYNKNRQTRIPPNHSEKQKTSQRFDHTNRSPHENYAFSGCIFVRYFRCCQYPVVDENDVLSFSIRKKKVIIGNDSFFMNEERTNEKKKSSNNKNLMLKHVVHVRE